MDFPAGVRKLGPEAVRMQAEGDKIEKTWVLRLFIGMNGFQQCQRSRFAEADVSRNAGVRSLIDRCVIILQTISTAEARSTFGQI